MARELLILVGKERKMQRLFCVNKICQCDLDCDLKTTIKLTKNKVMLLLSSPCLINLAYLDKGI